LAELNISDDDWLDTPNKIGRCYTPQLKKLVGDCGFGMEESVFGGRFTV
jgi:hypothetical protein